MVLASLQASRLSTKGGNNIKRHYQEQRQRRFQTHEHTYKI